MDAQREAELQNAARHVVSLLRSALATESCSPSRMDEGQVQREQVSAGSRQHATPLQGQATPGNRVQSAVRPQQTLSVAAPRNSVDQSMARAFPGLFKARKGFPTPKKGLPGQRQSSFSCLIKVLKGLQKPLMS
ncbi:hypothetical protein G5714_000799 [Onychostoma macrolepis]|uniref:Uncharacterized protein n=1 Tax=Onychostoma macrolepis TaxID=369639 RepID=A0A7J6DHJ6_9TELE|nr:hypothetical protein G5714_000799 [Onychostoma macrolepis]